MKYYGVTYNEDGSIMMSDEDDKFRHFNTNDIACIQGTVYRVAVNYIDESRAKYICLAPISSLNQSGTQPSPADIISRLREEII